MAKNYDKLLVINIPRNGCYCIPWKDLPGFELKEKPVSENPIITNARIFKKPEEGRFDTFLELKSVLNVSEFDVISVVRNPFTRTYSMYIRYLELCDLIREDKSFKNFLLMIKNNLPHNSIARNMLHKTQSSYLKNEQGAVEQSIQIFKYEQLNLLKEYLDNTELFNYVKRRVDNDSELDVIKNVKSFDKVRSPKQITKSAWLNYVEQLKKLKLIYNINELKEDYDSESVDIVKEIFNEDFDNFGYSRNIDDII